MIFFLLLAEKSILCYCAPDPPGTTSTNTLALPAGCIRRKRQAGAQTPKARGPRTGAGKKEEGEGTQQRWARAVLGGEDDALADIRVTSRVVSDHLTATYFEVRACDL